MIVQPDFLDHWKTQTLVASLSDTTAPIMVIRLWAHCQQRKAGSFAGLTATALKGICRAHSHDAEVFETAMLAAGFIERDGDTLVVHEWAETNAGLLASWQNGQKGGRPAKKKPTGNPRVSHGFSTGIPQGTDGQPAAKPIREDESRLDETNGAIAPASGSFARPTREVFDAHVVGHMGMTLNDAEHVWNVYGENGWTRAQAGKRIPIEFWRKTLSTWKTGHHFPSQKTNGFNGHSHDEEPAVRRCV